MKKNSRTGSRLFFLEFLIVIFFFLIISTICLKLFASARMLTQNAAALSRAQQISSSIAELFESKISETEFLLTERFLHEKKETQLSIATFAQNGVDQTVKKQDISDGTQIAAEIRTVFPQYVCESSAQDASADCFFDRNFEPCEKPQAFYTVTVSLQTQGNETQLSITTFDQSETVLYQLPATFHTPFTKGDAS